MLYIVFLKHTNADGLCTGHSIPGEKFIYMVHLSSKVPRFTFTTTHSPLGLMQLGARKLFKHPCLSICLSVSPSLPLLLSLSFLLALSLSLCKDICTCMWSSEGNFGCHASGYPLLFEAESLSDPQVNLLGQNGWLDTPMDPPGCISECTSPCLAFLCGFWGLNSGLHANKVSTLPTE